jgi:hypothetical protein
VRIASAASVPPAPGLFSTTTACLSVRDAASPKARKTWSVGPPAGKAQ